MLLKSQQRSGTLGSLTPFGSLFLLTTYTGFLEMLSSSRFGKNTVLLDLLVKTLQSTLEMLVSTNDYFSHFINTPFAIKYQDDYSFCIKRVSSKAPDLSSGLCCRRL